MFHQILKTSICCFYNVVFGRSEHICEVVFMFYIYVPVWIIFCLRRRLRMAVNSLSLSLNDELRTWRGGRGGGRSRTPRRPLRPTGRSTASRAPGQAGRDRQGRIRQVLRLAAAPSGDAVSTSDLVCRSFMLRHPLGVLAALRGGQLSHADLPVTGAHGQRGVATVGEELGLQRKKGRSLLFIILD